MGVAKWKGRREARGGECMLAHFQGENCEGERDREEHRERGSGGSVLGDASWRGDREVVSGEGGKKVI